MIRTYTDLVKRRSFQARFKYLQLSNVVGELTFGHNRHLNQGLYHSSRWIDVRERVIIRDDGCDLGILGYEIYDAVFVHHINPITILDIERNNPDMYNPEYLISTSFNTHQAIHFGDESLLPKAPIVRQAGDTTLW